MPHQPRNPLEDNQPTLSGDLLHNLEYGDVDDVEKHTIKERSKKLLCQFVRPIVSW
jgi:hypothetical protein